MNARLLALGAVAAILIPAASASAAPTGPTAQSCSGAGNTAVALCYGADVLTRDAQAYTQPGRYDSRIADYEQSWTHRALQLQYALANDVGFDNAPWLGTHNSFNSIAEEGPSLSDTDANQQLRLTDQLRLDMRSLELDVHWFHSVRKKGDHAPVVCHAGVTMDNDGCSSEVLLGSVLSEIAHWLDANRHQVLLLYLEDHVKNGYEPTAAVINRTLGSKIYRTGWRAGACKKLPLGVSRDDVLAAGAQVVIVTGCGGSAGWRGFAFDWGSHFEDRPHGYSAAPTCGAETPAFDYGSRLVRYYEDSTWLTTGAAQAGQGSVDDGLTPATVTNMTHCGVDLFGFDQLTPDDGRLDAAVWSWAKDQPAADGYCSAMGADGRWSSTNCKPLYRVACRRPGGTWVVPDALVPAKDAGTTCAAAGGQFAVPRTGYENEQLKAAAGPGAPVWLGYIRSGDGWSPLDSR